MCFFNSCNNNYSCGCSNNLFRRNSCCGGYNYIVNIPTNTLPRPPIVTPIVSTIGTYNATTGTLATGATLPLGTSYIQTGTGAAVDTATNSISLSNGLYRVSYGASATGADDTAILSLAASGTTLPQSTASADVTAADDIARLSSSVLVDARTSPVTLTLVNGSAGSGLTFNNVTLTATQVR